MASNIRQKVDGIVIMATRKLRQNVACLSSSSSVFLARKRMVLLGLFVAVFKIDSSDVK